MRALAFIPLSAAMLCWNADAASAARRSSVEIVAPRHDEQIVRSTQVVGRLAVPGKPIVLVRPEGGDGHWWLQPPIEIGARGYFRTNARFGSGKEPAGAKFTIVVAVLRNKRELELFKDRESLQELPRGILRSGEVVVTLKAKAVGQGASAASIVSPSADATVGARHEVRGQLSSASDAVPVVLVRAEQPNSLWWVQGSPTMGQDKSFRISARFGNASTPAGMKFRVLVGSPATTEAAAQMKPGASFKTIPDGFSRSHEIRVQRGSSETNAP